MAARDEEGDERGREVAVLQCRREQMAFHVMDADERPVARVGERLGIHDADEQRAREARARSDRDGVYRRHRDARFRDGAIHDRGQRGEVRAARQLRHDAAEHLVHVLRQDDQACELAIDQNRGRRLVAGRLDAEDDVSHGESGCDGAT